MYCLLQLYLCVSTELAPHHPVLKLLSVKAVGGCGLSSLVVLGSRGIRSLHSIFDFLAIHFSVIVEHVRGCQRRMTFAVCRFANPVSDTIFLRRLI